VVASLLHGTHEEKLALIQMIRKVGRDERKPYASFGDLQGPKIRTGKLKDHLSVPLKAGNRLTITPRDSWFSIGGGHHLQDPG